MLDRSAMGALALAAALAMSVAGAKAFDDASYPDWSVTGSRSALHAAASIPPGLRASSHWSVLDALTGIEPVSPVLQTGP